MTEINNTHPPVTLVLETSAEELEIKAMQSALEQVQITDFSQKYDGEAYMYWTIQATPFEFYLIGETFADEKARMENLELEQYEINNQDEE